MSGPACIRVVDLAYRYGPEILALNKVNIEIAGDAYLAIVGQNGSGKTTLVKHFNGLLKPAAGHVFVNGQDTRETSVGALARDVGYVFQNPDHQIFCAITREEIAFGPRNLGLDPEVVRDRTEDALRAFGLTDHAETPPALLGYGLRRKVSVASVCAMHSRILILDEPTTGLDRRSARELMALVDDLHAGGHTIILVTHDMRLVAEHAQQVLVMHEGRVLTYGSTREVFGQIDTLAQAQIVPPQITRLGRALADCGFAGDILTVDAFCRDYGRLLERRPEYPQA